MRHSEEFSGMSDAEVYEEIVSRLQFSSSDTLSERFKQIARLSELLQMAPHIMVTAHLKRTALPKRHQTFGEQGAGKILTCGKCGITSLVDNPERFSEFVTRHAGCE
jgi:hypothetical protein